MRYSNRQISDTLRSVAAALALKNRSLFEIRAYETAADAVEHLSSEVADLYEEGRLDQIPGVGKTIQSALEDLFRHGHSKHFNSIMGGIPTVAFELIQIPGVGPKTARELARLGVKSTGDLKEQLKSGRLAEKGFPEKLGERILGGITEQATLKTGRMLLPYATFQAQKIVTYLKRSPDVLEADPLGSLRRQVATVGDLDFAVSSRDSRKVVEYFTRMPSVSEVVEAGESRATVVLSSGIHADLLAGVPDSYGALLQHFTGSKHHNIKLRTYAEKKGLSLSEYGIKDNKTGRIILTKTEDALYKLLGMQTPEPEIRENSGEIEAALRHQLPKLVTVKEIKGDLHLHSNFPMEHPSHGPGANSIPEIVEKGVELDYQYIGVSDHPPGMNTMSEEETVRVLRKRTEEIEHIKSSCKAIRVLNGLEIDILPNGTLSVPNAFLETLDYVIAGVHSSHRMGKEQMTKRILAALENPNVDILAHPTGRILNERDSAEMDWKEIFKFCAKNKKLLEINSFYNRLDLRDDLVRLALCYGVKFVIDTDAHEVAQMGNIPFGVAVARRGWAESKDIVNSWDWAKFAKWFNLG